MDASCGKATPLQLAGQLGRAERLYRDVLRAESLHAVANHRIGMLKVQTQLAAESLPFLQAALHVNRHISEYWLGYREVLPFAASFSDIGSALIRAVSKVWRRYRGLLAMKRSSFS